MSRILLAAIDLYQRFLSPLKGFRCAHSAHFGGVSCSVAVKEIIRIDGVLGGLPSIRERMQACSMAAEELRKDGEPARWKRKRIGACQRLRKQARDDVRDCPCEFWVFADDGACAAVECLSGGADACACWPF